MARFLLKGQINFHNYASFKYFNDSLKSMMIVNRALQDRYLLNIIHPLAS